MWKQMLAAVGVIAVVGGLALAAIVGGGSLGQRAAGEVSVPTVETPPDHPVLQTTPAPIATPGHLDPAPTVTYSWNPADANACFNPSDPNLPANAPRCPGALHIPPDPGGPKAYCPPGQALVYPSNQPTCLPTSPR